MPCIMYRVASLLCAHESTALARPPSFDTAHSAPKPRFQSSCVHGACFRAAQAAARGATAGPAVQVTSIASDAKFILLVEKDAAFMRLAEDRFYNTYPCIILTAKGQPDVATRLFLRKLRSTLNIPVLALVDSDPYGLKILSTPPPPRVSRAAVLPPDALCAHHCSLMDRAVAVVSWRQPLR